jgi:Zn-dependent protease with chaperone function
MPIKRTICACLAALSLFGPACIRNPATHKVHARLLSQESERRIGEETKKKIIEEYRVLKSTTVSDYVSRVGQKLAAVSDRPTVDYDFTVLDQDLINAFAVPGGFIFVTRGLLDSMDDEGELAMVLGHEIGHVAALHGVQMIQKEMGQNALTILGTIGAAIAAGPEAMLMMANTANLFSSLYMLGYSRDRELEADRLGIQYTLRAGYDPHAALRFFKKLQEGEDKNLGGWDLYFRTHPPTADRISIIESMIGKDGEDASKSNRADYQRVKETLPRVDVRERGVIEGQTYENPVHRLEISVPSNWHLGFYYSQALVSFETSDKKAEGRLQVVDLREVEEEQRPPEENTAGKPQSHHHGKGDKGKPVEGPQPSTATAHHSLEVVTPESLAIQYGKVMDYKYVGGRSVLYTAGYGFLGRFLGISASGKELDIRLFATIRHGRGYILLVGAPPEEQETYLLDLEAITRALKFNDV